MIKVHITGGNGFVGSNMFNNINNKYIVEKTDIDTLNVMDIENLKDYFLNNTPDIIIHLAGLMGAGESKINCFKYFSVNSFGVLNVLEAARLANIKNIIFLSSLTVHGFNDIKNTSKKESDLYFPLHTYATSKIIGEYMINDYSRFHQINSIILRPSIIVGNFDGEPNAINEFVHNSLNNIPLTIYGNGKHKREYLSVNDLIKSINCAIKFLLDLTISGYHNEFIVSSRQPISMENLAKLIIKKTGKGKINKIKSNSKSFNLTTNSTKINKILNWEIEDNIEDIINETINIYTAK